MDPRIERLQRIGAARPDVIGLGGGLPAAVLFPRARLAEAFVRAMRAPEAQPLQYGWPEGIDRLRAWIAARLRARGADASDHDVIVTAGAQQAIALAAQALLRKRAKVAVDRETYPAALELFRTRGAVPVSDPAVPAACHYVMPGVANPRGEGMSDERRARLLQSGRPIIADEAYAELRFDGAVSRPLLADAPDRVWHVGTFSKTLCPGLRVGWLVPPRDARDRVLRLKHDLDLQAGSLAQHVVAEFLAEDDEAARLARARAFYAARAERLARALRRELPSWRFAEPEGGFSIFVETDAAGDDARFLARATERGVSFDPGRIFRADDRSAPIALRLCFSAAPAAALEEGVRRLARAWAELGREGLRAAG